MSELDLDAIEARAKAATPGPWNYEHDTELEKGCRCGSCLEPIDGRMIVESRKHDMVAVADARFIAHAREDVPALIAELRKLREENARLEERDVKMTIALTGLLRFHDKCGMESSYGVYAREVLEGLPAAPEVNEDDEDACRLDQADMPGGFP